MKSKPVSVAEIKFFLGKSYFEVGFYELAESFFKECQAETNDSIIQILAHDYLFSVYRKQKHKIGN